MLILANITAYQASVFVFASIIITASAVVLAGFEAYLEGIA